MFGFKVIAIILYVYVSVLGVKSHGDCVPRACEVRMRTDAGCLCGRIRNAEDGTKYASFRGVPYGKPPVGKRRFKELEPLDPWEGHRDATDEGPACPQKELIYGRITLYKTGMSEDCIYLNLHVPFNHLPQEKNRLPILVVIHGGGFNSGSGLSDLHGPEYLMTKNVVVITFNYRINVFGFLSLNSKEIPGNQALRDQVTLLRWVQRNARAFGGDPDNVTLIGHSAGSSCTHLLTMSKATEGLFKRAILMSGTAVPNFFTASQRFAKDIANVFLKHLGINSTDPSDIHKQLVRLPLLDIMQANTIVQNDFGLTSFVPVVEDEYPGITRILDSTPLDLIAQGRGKEYPFLIGFTDKESEFFRWYCYVIDLLRRVEENTRLLLSPRLIYNLGEDELSNLTLKVNDKCFKGTKTLDKILSYIDYLYFKYPAIKVADWRAKYAPVYLYQYSYRSERSLIKEALWSTYEGAAHGEDFIQVFRVNSMLGNYVSIPPKNNDDRMKEFMTTMVTNFMRCSNPTCTQDEREWPRFRKDKALYQNIAEPHVYRMTGLSAEESDMVRFIDSIDEGTRELRN